MCGDTFKLRAKHEDPEDKGQESVVRYNTISERCDASKSIARRLRQRWSDPDDRTLGNADSEPEAHHSDDYFE
jgi:hypothetical protein